MYIYYRKCCTESGAHNSYYSAYTLMHGDNTKAVGIPQSEDKTELSVWEMMILVSLNFLVK